MNQHTLIHAVNEKSRSRDLAQLIEKIEGDYPSIVGLPLWRIAKVLEQQGVVLPNPIEDIFRLKPYENLKDFS